MTVNLRVLVPEETTNYVANPSLRYDTTGYTATGSTLSRTLDQARFNVASLKVDTNGVVLYEGCYYRVSSLVGISEPITASVYVRGAGIVRLRLINNPFGQQWYSQPVYLDDMWTRISVSGYSTGSDDLRVYVETDQRAQDTVFYVDGVQLERKSQPTTFCDGDQPGCLWKGIYNASSSSRTPYTRQGGRWVDLAGPCRADDNIYATVMAGMGMAPKSLQKQPWALEPGSYFQNNKVLERSVTINFHIKNKSVLFRKSPKLDAIHALRQQLIDIFKPDGVPDSEPFMIEYSDGNKTLTLSVRYDGGLEGELDVRNQWWNSMAVRFLAEAPFFQEDNYNVKQLSFIKTYSHATKKINFMARIDGEWAPYSPDGTGFWDASNTRVFAITIGLKGEVYLGGYRVYKWDGSTFVSMGDVVSSGSPSAVVALTVAPNGDLYAIGPFTQINGVLIYSVARWNGSNWSAVGVTSTLSLAVTQSDVLFAKNGQLYVCGAFSSISGVSANRIARWDGFQWRPVGALNGVTSNTVKCLAESIDGREVYLGGNFSGENGGGLTLGRIAAINEGTNLFSALRNGLGPAGRDVSDIVVEKDGTILAVGGFIDNGTDDIYYSAFWNGKEWFQLGEAVNAVATGTTVGFTKLAIDPTNGQIWLAGIVSDFRGLDYQNLTKWNGDRRSSGGFFSPDILWPYVAGTTSLYDLKVDSKGNVYFCAAYSSGGLPRVDVAAVTEVENTGSATAYPRIYITGPGELRYIENLTTKSVVPFSMTLFDDEDVTIDFATGTVESSVRGDLSPFVNRAFSMKDFKLLPGINRISVLMTNDVGSVMQIGYTPVHWAADAVVEAEALV